MHETPQDRGSTAFYDRTDKSLVKKHRDQQGGKGLRLDALSTHWRSANGECSEPALPASGMSLDPLRPTTSAHLPLAAPMIMEGP